MASNYTSDVMRSSSHKLSDHADIFSDVLFVSMGEGAIVVDERGFIARINQPALDILGFSEKELVGKWYPETIVAEDAAGKPIPYIERPIAEVFLSGKPIFRRIYYRRKDGSQIPVSLSVAPIMHEGKPMGAIQLFRDITEELRLEHAKDEFISIASHQLRTPATVVKQYLGLILEGFVKDKDKWREMIQIAYDQNDNQLDIINDLLKVAQIESNAISPSYKKTDLIKLLQKIVTHQKPHFDNRNIDLQFKHGQNPIKLEVDPLHVQMVFENLIDNANKYSDPGTTVNVSIAETSERISIHIKDEGAGIDPMEISKLFNKFSRIKHTSTAVNGTGLGLYWAQKLVELYNGKISVKSELHKGSTFTVSLPKKK